LPGYTFCVNEFSERFLRNTGLFPERIFDAELKRKLSDYPKKSSEIEAILALFDTAFERYKSLKDRLPDEDEEHLEVRFLRPVFERLGYELGKTYDFRPGIRRSHFVRKVPDYVFFRNEADFRAVEAFKNSSDPDENHRFFQSACALGEVKRWSAILDGRPADQLDGYLLRAGVDWGILTNGRLWRLFHRTSSSHLIYYLEFNLEAFLASYDPDQGGIYRRETNPQELLRDLAPFYLFFSREAFIYDQEGLCWLDRFFQRTKEELASLEEDLSRRVYSALETIAQGFFDYEKNNLSPENEEDLALVYQNSLILLYRLLFLFYAESPRRGKSLLPVEQENYEPYSLIYMVEEQLRKRHPRTLAKELSGFWGKLRSIFRLIDKGSPSLGIQAYNGKLFSDEAYPFLAEKELSDWHLASALKNLSLDDYGLYGEIRVDYSPLSIRQLGSIYEGLLEHKLVYRNGKVALLPTSRERKETGSYYTPDYIVKYIVENTLGPLTENANPEQILSLKVLDPAMGSGHFLVEAVDFLGKALARARSGGDEYDDEDLHRAKRDVVTRCIYGVDLNPLAVELAKLALWIHTAVPDKPLSFLENHLKCGNSLLGADPDLLWGPPPPNGKPEKDAGGIFNDVFKKSLSGALSLIAQIEAQPEETAVQVQEKERTYENALEKLRPFKQVADAWMAFFFDEKTSKNKKKTGMRRWKKDRRERAWSDLLAWLSNPHETKPPSCAARVALVTGQNLSLQRRFLHWQIEFPEVFFSDSRKENPGFDVVMGNPPYGIRIDEKEKRFIGVKFENGTPDSAAYFLELALNLTRKGGNFGMIVPKSIAFYREWRRIREILIENSSLMAVADVGIAFREVLYEQLILIFSTSALDRVKLSLFRPMRSPATEKSLWKEDFVNHKIIKEQKVFVFRNITETEEMILGKIESKSIFIKDLAEDIFGNLNLTNAKRASGKSEEELLQGPFTMRPEITSEENEFLFIRRDPHLRRYLVKYWYKMKVDEIIRKLLEGKVVPRIFIKPLRGRRLVSWVDEHGKIATHHHMISVVFKPGEKYNYYFAMSVINSKIPSFWMQKVIFSDTTETARELNRPYMERIPLPRISFSTPAKKRKDLFEKAKELYDAGDNDSLLKFVETCIQNGHSDAVHDLLAHLAKEMISLNNNLNNLAERFLLDLEGCRIPRKEAEKGRQAKHLRAVKSINPHLEGTDDNRRINLVSALAWKDKVAFRDLLLCLAESVPHLSEALEVYERYSPDYSEKYAVREFTDTLIDQIVYRLYGLAEEEIETIETWTAERSIPEE